MEEALIPDDNGAPASQAMYIQPVPPAFQKNRNATPAVRGKLYGTQNKDETKRQGVTVQRAGKKIGRNESCPCGKGKKFKNCCGKSLDNIS